MTTTRRPACSPSPRTAASASSPTCTSSARRPSAAGRGSGAWDNPSILEHVKHCLADVRAYREAHGLDKLTTATWPGDEHDGWEMTAATAFILRAEGAYRSPGDHGALFMVLRNVRRLSDSAAS